MQTSSGAKAVRLGNKDILAALNASGEYKFGPKATLLFVVSDDQPTGLIVQDGKAGQTTDTDVSAYFDVTEIGEGVRSPDGGMVWETWHFGFDNGNTNETAFELWGTTTIHNRPINLRRVASPSSSQRIESSIRGVGRLKGVVTIFSGTIYGGTFSLTNH
jgi:hypothetical protein